MAAKRRRRFNLGALPSYLWTALGMVPVRSVPRVDRDEDAFGVYAPVERCVEVCNVADPIAQRVTLVHEWVHVVLFDSGVRAVLTKEQHEAVCDAIGFAVAAELKATGKLQIAAEG